MTEQHPAEPTVDAFVSAGQKLRKAREERGLTVEELSSRLNIAAKYISAIENSDVEGLPGPAFVKGYIRACARYLEMSGDELVADYSRQFNVDGERKVTSINKVGNQVRLSDPLIRISMYLFLLAVLGVSVWWWQTQSGHSLSEQFASDSSQAEPASEESSPAAEQSPADLSDPADIQARLARAREAAEEQTAVTESGDDSGSESQESAAGEEPQYLSEEDIRRLRAELEQGAETSEQPADRDTTEPDSRTAPEQASTDVVEPQSTSVETTAETVQPATTEIPQAVAQATAENSSVQPAEQGPEISQTATEPASVTGQLKLTFVSDCWISIRNAGGKLVFARTKQAGETLELELEVPASLLVGRVSAVSSATFDGRELELASLARKDVARLTLEP